LQLSVLQWILTFMWKLGQVLNDILFHWDRFPNQVIFRSLKKTNVLLQVDNRFQIKWSLDHRRRPISLWAWQTLNPKPLHSGRRLGTKRIFPNVIKKGLKGWDKKIANGRRTKLYSLLYVCIEASRMWVGMSNQED
jgi:hypothetical protein